jgi:hypothetical protein
VQLIVIILLISFLLLALLQSFVGGGCLVVVLLEEVVVELTEAFSDRCYLVFIIKLFVPLSLLLALRVLFLATTQNTRPFLVI